MAKIHVDKKAHQAYCRAQAAKGLINDERGLWISQPSKLSGGSVDTLAGYHLKGGKKRSKKGAPEVE